MTLWTQAHINVDTSNTLKYLNENPTSNPTQLFESIKSDLAEKITGHDFKKYLS